MTARPAQTEYANRAPGPAGRRAGPLRHPSGWLVLTVVVLLGVAGAVAYAGPGRPEVVFRLLTDGVLAVVWVAVAIGWGAWPLVWLTRAGCRRSPSPGVPGEGWGGGLQKSEVSEADRANARIAPADGRRTAVPSSGPAGPLPNPPPEYRGRGNTAVLLTTAAALGLGLMSLLVLGFGLAGLLGRVASIGLLAAGLGLGGLWLYRSRDRLAARRPAAGPGPADPPAWDWLWLAAAPLLAAALAAAFVPPGLLWKPEEPHGYDAVEYHLQLPREWFEAGRIQPTPHNAFGYFPAGVEMHYLLAMHLTGGAWAGMYLAQLMHVAMVALAAVATGGVAHRLARDRRRDRRFATTAAVAGATVPWLAQLAPIAFNEGGLLLYAALTVGWTLRLCRGEGGRVTVEGGAKNSHTAPPSPQPAASATSLTPEPARSLAVRPFLLPSVLAGFACGVKLTAVPLLLLGVPFVAGVVLLRRSLRLAILGPLVFGLAGTATFAPWLVRNIAWTGNPVFPEGTAVFGRGHFSDEQVARWRRAHAPPADQSSAAARVAAFAGRVAGDWQFGFVLLPMAAAALATWMVPRRRRRGGDAPDTDAGGSAAWPPDDPEPLLLGGLLLIQLVFWLGFTHLQGRFFLPAVPVAVLLVATAPWGRLGGARATKTIAAGLAVVVGGAAAVNGWNVHRRLAFKLYEDQGTGVAVALGREEIQWITDVSLSGFPAADPTARLLLVGDAQAFWYPLPPGRLVYRTVFDLDTAAGGSPAAGRSLLDAFDPQGARRDGSTWMLIDPGELERYARTYQPFPAISEAWRRSPAWRAGRPFLVAPGTEEPR